jgi:hypothetical protein
LFFHSPVPPRSLSLFSSDPSSTSVLHGLHTIASSISLTNLSFLSAFQSSSTYGSLI